MGIVGKIGRETCGTEWGTSKLGSHTYRILMHKNGGFGGQRVTMANQSRVLEQMVIHMEKNKQNLGHYFKL